MSNYRELAKSGEWVKVGDFELCELSRQEYTVNNCVFAVGLVDNHPFDTHYLWLEKDQQEPMIILLRPDELAAIAWLASGALWSELIQKTSGALLSELIQKISPTLGGSEAFPPEGTL